MRAVAMVVRAAGRVAARHHAPHLRRHGKRASTIAAAALLLAACAATPPQGRDTATSSAASPVGSTPALPLLSVHVEAGIDEHRVASATVGSDGGTLEVADASGTTIRVSIPAGAVLGDTAVQLRPISAVRGMPGGAQFLAGVSLQPEGLELLAPATVSLTGPRVAAATLAFGYHGSGDGYYTLPFDRTDAGLTVTVSHFSGVGAASGGTAGPPTGTSQQDAAASAIAGVLAGAKSTGSLSPADLRQLLDILDLWYHQGVAPAITTAGDVDAFVDAFGQYDVWLRYATFLGLTTQLQTLIDEGGRLLAQALNRLVGVSFDRCVNEHQVAEAAKIARLLKIGATAGLEAYGFDAAGALDRLTRCLRFKLKVHSRVSIVSNQTMGNTDLISVAGTVDAEVLLPWDGGPMTFTAPALVTGLSGLDWKDDPFDDPCEVSNVRSTSVTITPALRLASDPAHFADPGSAFLSLGLNFPDVLDTNTCDGFASEGENLWLRVAFELLHEDALAKKGVCMDIDYIESGSIFVFTGFRAGTGEVFGTRAFHHSGDLACFPYGPVDEDTTLTIVHAPGR